MIASLERIDWHRFLARPRVAAPSGEMLDPFRNTSILITGAGGSIGSALALRLAAHEPRPLVLLESSESNLFALQQTFEKSPLAARPSFVLGGLHDSALLDEIFRKHAPRIVFHAAAFKQVPLLEEQPLAAVENNVFGTRHLVSAASAHGARVVLLSTDKAVEPASIMGATKRIAEHIVRGSGGTALRLGNVLASRDSVAEVFAGFITAGQPITVTDPAARRFFLTLDEAVDLLLAAVGPEPPVLLAPDLPTPHFIVDLARFMAGELSPGRGVRIEFSQLRAGDKEAEILWSSTENVVDTTVGSLLRIESPMLDAPRLRSALDTLRSALDSRDSIAVLGILRDLVPDYTPSDTLLAQFPHPVSRVSP